jgi:hypothetical protein
MTTRHKISCGGEGACARSGDIEVISELIAKISAVSCIAWLDLTPGAEDG